MRIRHFKLSLLISIWATCAFFSYSAKAQSIETYPSKPIVVVLGFPAGSGADIICRFFADQISAIAGQRLLIENRVGAFSAIAMANVSSAKPDGYKILWTGSSVMAGGRHMVKQMPNDPQKDFLPVGLSPILHSCSSRSDRESRVHNHKIERAII